MSLPAERRLGTARHTTRSRSAPKAGHGMEPTNVWSRIAPGSRMSARMTGRCRGHAAAGLGLRHCDWFIAAPSISVRAPIRTTGIRQLHQETWLPDGVDGFLRHLAGDGMAGIMTFADLMVEAFARPRQSERALRREHAARLRETPNCGRRTASFSAKRTAHAVATADASRQFLLEALPP
jgi:hypothetical protein